MYKLGCRADSSDVTPEVTIVDQGLVDSAAAAACLLTEQAAAEREAAGRQAAAAAAQVAREKAAIILSRAEQGTGAAEEAALPSSAESVDKGPDAQQAAEVSPRHAVSIHITAC